MKVYTIEFSHEFEEDFGHLQYHFLLESVFSTYEAAHSYALAHGRLGPDDDYRIREFVI